MSYFFIILLSGLKNHFTLLKDSGLLLLLILLLTLILLIYLLYKPVKVKVKIENFFFAWLAAFIYIVFYIIFFFYLRYNVIGTTINLKESFNKITNIFININNFSLYKQILAYILILILIVLWFLIFIKLRKKLSYKIWQLYFYYNFSFNVGQYLTKVTNYREKDYPLYIKIFKKLANQYSFHGRRFALISEIKKLVHNIKQIKKPVKNIKQIKTEYEYDWIWALNETTTGILQSLIRLFPIILLLIIFSLDLFINNLNLYYIFYYLPFYLIIMLWIKATDVMKWYDSGFESIILHEMAYSYPEIIYINLSSMERLRLKSFLNYNQKVYKSVIIGSVNFVKIGISTTDRIIAYLRYEKIILNDGRTIYYNLNKNLYFEKKYIKKDGKYYLVDEEENNNL